MTIDLPGDLEQFVRDAVAVGLYPREDDVIRDALARLRQAMPPAPEAQGTTQGPVTPEELNRRLFAAGLIIQLPNSAEDVDDDDDLPFEIEGEPLSETIIRERR